MAEPTARSDELAALLARVALQDRHAFERLYQRTSAHLLGLAWGILGTRERAEEVLQDAFMAVWHRASQYQAQRGQPMTWLIQIVRHQAIDRLRSGRSEQRHTRPLDDDSLQLPDSAEREPLHLLETGLTQARVQACMAGLAATQRQALALAYYRGLLHAEIAGSLGVPVSTVKAWVRRGLDKLRDCLSAAGEAGA